MLAGSSCWGYTFIFEVIGFADIEGKGTDNGGHKDSPRNTQCGVHRH